MTESALAVITETTDPARANRSVQVVWGTLHDLKRGTAATPRHGVSAGIGIRTPFGGPTRLGTARGHTAITTKILRQFQGGLSDNTRHLDDGVFFGDRDLVAFTGWPSGTAPHTGDGFLKLTPTGRRIPAGRLTSGGSRTT